MLSVAWHNMAPNLFATTDGEIEAWNFKMRGIFMVEHILLSAMFKLCTRCVADLSSAYIESVMIKL